MLSARGSSNTTREPSVKSIVARANRGSSSPVPIHEPVAGHAKMRMQRAAVVEQKQLMLAAALDGANSRAAQRTQPCRRQLPLERRMQQRHLRDRLACRGAPQAANSTLDLGQFRHRSIRRRLTSGLGAAQVARVASPTQSIAARNQQAHDARSPAVRKTLARRARAQRDRRSSSRSSSAFERARSPSSARRWSRGSTC